MFRWRMRLHLSSRQEDPGERTELGDNQILEEREANCEVVQELGDMYRLALQEGMGLNTDPSRLPLEPTFATKVG